MQHLAKNVKKEQPLLNKRANREIDKPCEAGGGEGSAAEENKEKKSTNPKENEANNVTARKSKRQ